MHAHAHTRTPAHPHPPTHPCAPHRRYEGDGTVFSVRAENYKLLKKKEPSAPSLFKLVDVQIHRTKSKVFNVGAKLPLPTLEETDPFFFVANVALPDYVPSMWQSEADGVGWSLIMYYVIPKEVLEATKADEPAEPWAKGLKKFLEAPCEDVDAETKAVHQRMKIISLIQARTITLSLSAPFISARETCVCLPQRVPAPPLTVAGNACFAASRIRWTAVGP